MFKRLRTSASVAVNTVVAVFGTAVLESPLARALHARNGSAVIWREWITSIVVALALGFAVKRSWKSSGAVWAWILPTVFFVFKVLTDLGSGRVASQFSGYECAVELVGGGCRIFLLVTVPLVRGVAYSAGAAFAGTKQIRSSSNTYN